MVQFCYTNIAGVGVGRMSSIKRWKLSPDGALISLPLGFSRIFQGKSYATKQQKAKKVMTGFNDDIYLCIFMRGFTD